MNRQVRRAMKFKRDIQASGSRYVDSQAGLRVLHMARPYEESEMVTEHLITHAAYERLRDGSGTEEDFDRVSMILNVGLVRAEDVENGGLLVETMQRAQQAMLRMKGRYQRGLRFGFDAQGLMDVPEALSAYTELMPAGEKG